jgi:hypothetical protein
MSTIASMLGDAAGSWTGTNGFRLMPTDALRTFPATMAVSLAAGRHVADLAYAWTHPDDGPQDGLLVLGASDDEGSVVALWGDSWHQHPAPAICEGSIEDHGVIGVGYEYGDGWRWWITVDARDPAVLRLRMENVVPTDQADAAVPVGAYPVMVMDLPSRVSPSL